MGRKIKYPRDWTRREVSGMLRIYREGATLAEVGARYDLTATRVGQLFRRERLDYRTHLKSGIIRTPNLKSQLGETELSRLYLDELKTIGEIARILETSYNGVRRNLNQYKIPVRSKRVVRLNEKAETKVIDRATLEMLITDKKLSVAQLTAEYNCSRITIYRWLRKFGISAPAKTRTPKADG